MAQGTRSRPAARWLPAALGSTLTVLGAAAACSADDSAEMSDGASTGGGFGAGATSSTGGASALPNTGGTGGTAGDPLPPETEVPIEFERPHAGQRYVYVANPNSDSVAIIDASTLAIETVEAGDEPRYLETLGDEDAALVLNLGSADLTWIRTTNGTSTTRQIPVLPGSNALAVSPDGRHALVYVDAARVGAGVSTGSFQDVSVIALGDQEAERTDLTIGFRPSRVFFSEDGARALIVTDDGISVLDFEAIASKSAGIAPTLPLVDVTEPSALDVSVTADGRYAVTRQPAANTLRLLEIASGESTVLDVAALLPAASTEPEPDPDAGSDGGVLDPGAEPPASAGGLVTDLDLTSAGDVAVAAVRDRGRLLKIPVPEGFSDPELVEVFEVSDVVAGSITLTPAADRALVYTTADLSAERIAVVDLSTGTTDALLDLRKSVAAVAIAPDASSALVLHQRVPGNPGDPGLSFDEQVDRSPGYSLVSLEAGFAKKLQLTAEPPGPFTIVPDNSSVFLLFGGQAREVHRANLDNFIVDRVALGSLPLSIGAVPQSERVFVGQEHPDGRITFIDWNSLALKSVTGFELNSRIRE